MSTISLGLPSDGQTIDASDVNTPLNTIAAVINGNLDDTNIASGANINGTKLLANSTALTALDAQSRGGWIVGALAAPNTITYNGNRNYSIVFNTVDYSSVLSNGMRLKLTRTVTAPTQCTSLNGSTQYYSKTTPAGYTFTDSFTYSAWVKPSSYALGTIIGRFGATGSMLQMDASGRLLISAKDAGTTDSCVTAQSIPLNKWTHVAMTMVVATNTVTAYIDGVAVATTYTNGTTTAVTQAGNLEVGGNNGGTNPFPGKIAQAAVYSAVLSAATIAATQTQTLTGSETSLVSAYSFNNSINDLNANANNLTPQGSAVATNPDSPFAGGANASTAYTAGTTEFGEVFNVSFSTNTTIVVQVPDGYNIPTSGGISAVAYSTQASPLGWLSPVAVIGYAVKMVDTTATNTTDNTVISGLSATCYIPAGRQVEVSVNPIRAAFNSGANNTFLSLWSGTVGSGTKLDEVFTGAGTTVIPLPGASRIFTPSAAGSNTFNVGAYVSAGTGTYQMSATYPAELKIRLV